MNGKNVHVVPNNDKWAVKEEGIEKEVSTHDSKELAISMGRELAIKNKAELVVHNLDGKISQKDSFGNDPRNSKG